MVNALTNFEIIDIIKDRKLDKHFGGVYSKEQLPELKKTNFISLIYKITTKEAEHIGQCFIIITLQHQYILIHMVLLRLEMYKNE
jgi:hypothetical protein